MSLFLCQMVRSYMTNTVKSFSPYTWRSNWQSFLLLFLYLFFKFEKDFFSFFYFLFSFLWPDNKVFQFYYIVSRVEKELSWVLWCTICYCSIRLKKKIKTIRTSYLNKKKQEEIFCIKFYCGLWLFIFLSRKLFQFINSSAFLIVSK